MRTRPLAFDPATATHSLWHEDHDGTIVVETEQDVEAVIEDAKIRYNMHDERSPFKGDTGLERVEAIGFGVCLTRADVLWDVGFPWFETRRDEKLGVNVGEDVDFCIKARAAGHDVFVDHGLSHEVRHIGSMEYSVAHAVAFQEEQAHGDNKLQLVTDGDKQLAESVGRDDAGNYPRLHSVGGSEAESDGGDS